MFATLLFGDLTDRTNPIIARAAAEARDTCEREDIPKDAPLHLRDEAPRFYKTKAGYRTTSRLHINDVLMGEPSIVQVLLHAISPALIAVLGLVAMLAPGLAAMFAGLFFVFYVLLGAKGGSKFLIVLVLGTISGTLLTQVGRVGLDFTSMSSSLYLLAAFFTCLTPLLIDISYGAGRERELLEQGQRFSGASHDGKDLLFSKPLEARQEQVERAKNDTSPFLVLGEAQGVFAATSQDAFAPDAGLPYGMTLKDIRDSHLLVLGETGSGKTSGVLRPLAGHWIANKAGGALFLDGKAAFGEDVAQIPGVQLITPGVSRFSLTQGLRAEQIATVLKKFGSYDGAGADPFWAKSAFNMTKQAFMVLEYAQPENSAYAVAMTNGLRIIDDEGYRNAAIDAIQTSGKSIPRFVNAAIHYFQVVFPGLEGPTRAGVVATVQSWINPLLDRDLLDWSDATDGVDITDVCNGALIALNVPTSLYGEAGLLVQQFAKYKVYRALRERGKKWTSMPGHTPVMVMIDEAQEIISDGADQEGTMLAIARDHGVTMVLAMQDINSAYGRFLATGGSREACKAALQQCKSYISFRASNDSMQWIRERMDKTMRRQVIAKSEGIAFDALAKSVIESGALRPNSFLLRVVERLASPQALMGTVWGIIKPRTAEREQEDGKSTRKAPDGSVEHEFGITSGYEMKTDFVFSEGEAVLLNTPLLAVASLMNAGVPRRDIFKCRQVFDFGAIAKEAA